MPEGEGGAKISHWRELSKLRSNNLSLHRPRKHRKISSTYQKQLCFRPIYSYISSSRPAFDDEATSTNEWTTVSLPVTLGRRHFVEAWWKGCPSYGCQSRQHLQTRRTAPSDSKTFSACIHCRPSLDARRVLALSKAMVHVNHKGRLEITARHRQLIHFRPKNLDHNMNRDSRNAKTFNAADGTLSLGTDASSNMMSKMPPGIWMQFQFRLESMRNRDEAATSLSNSKGPKNDSLIWHSADESRKSSIGGWRGFGAFPSTRRSHYVNNDFLESEDEDDHQDSTSNELNVKSHPTARTLVFDDAQNVLPRDGSSRCGRGPVLQFTDAILQNDNRMDSSINNETKSNFVQNDPVRNCVQKGVTRKVSSHERGGKDKTIHNCAVDGQSFFRKSVIPSTPHGAKITTPTVRVITPDVKKSGGKAMKCVRETTQSQCRKRRLMELDDMVCSESADAKNLRSHPAALSISPSTDRTASVGMTSHSILSMPDDQSSDEASSARCHVLMKEVATQGNMTQPRSIDTPKLVHEMTCDDWRNIHTRSRPNSFIEALCDLVLHINEPAKEEQKQNNLWLPPLLDRNASTDKIRKSEQ